MRWSNSTITAAGVDMHLRRGGDGPPILLLHREIGSPDSLPFYDALAGRHTVYIPHHPGFGLSPRPDWLANVRDIAVIHRALLGQLGIAQATLVGLGFGGWIGAEMATFGPNDTAGMVLVGPMGVKPPEGDILDQALLSYIEYVRAGFHDPSGFDNVFGARPTSEQLVQWDICREMSFRVAWKPYMYNDSLPHLLPGARARTLLVHGAQDQVVPISASRVYAARLPNARLEIMADVGHLIEMERPEALADLIASFIAA